METTLKFVLKDEIKELIRKNKQLKNKLQVELNISHSTLYRWLNLNDSQATDYNLLLIVWLFIAENSELREKYSHIKNLENLLTSK